MFERGETEQTEQTRTILKGDAEVGVRLIITCAESGAIKAVGGS